MRRVLLATAISLTGGLAHAEPPDVAGDTDAVDGDTDGDASEREAPTATTRSNVEEITVVGKARVEQARQRVIADAADAGYTRVVRKDGRTMLRHERPWRGQIWVYDDGRVDLRRNPIRFEPRKNQDKPTAWFACIWIPYCLQPAGQIVSPNRLRTYQREAMAAIEDDVTVWHEALADAQTQARVDALPDQLLALWEHGTPLEGDGPALEGVAARKAALLAFWDSRTDTVWGERVRQTVEAFLRGVVQASDTPLTDDEIAAFNAGRHALHPLSLHRPAPAPAPASEPEAPVSPL